MYKLIGKLNIINTNKNNGLKIKECRGWRYREEWRKKNRKIAQKLPFGIKELHVKTRQSFSIFKKRTFFILKILK